MITPHRSWPRVGATHRLRAFVGSFVGTIACGAISPAGSAGAGGEVSAIRRRSVSHSRSVRDRSGARATREKPGGRTGGGHIWHVALIPRASENFVGGAGAVALQWFSSTVTWPQQDGRNLVAMIVFDHALDRGGSKWSSTWIVGKQGMVTGTRPPVSMHARSRPVFRIRAATSRLVQSCRDAGGHSAVLRSVINPASPSTARW